MEEKKFFAGSLTLNSGPSLPSLALHTTQITAHLVLRLVCQWQDFYRV